MEKKSKNITKTLLTVLFLVVVFGASAQKNEYPRLILQKKDVPALKAAIQKNEILKYSFKNIKAEADAAAAGKIIVPLPKDPGGGYTHEKHKSNYRNMYAAGLAYQLTGEKKYAEFVTNMLLKYADMYPTLPLHPKRKKNKQSSGKLFWQNLNETVWLTYTIQAYDCVIDAISKNDKKKIDKNVFHEMVNFIMVDNKRSFDKVHNHGTWAAAGVGMAGYVLGEEDWVKNAIYGTKRDQKSGFLKQIDHLFSPDGFYSEGPYYQRYALMPFMVFAQAIENNQPEVKIFEFKDKVLGKAVETVLQLTTEDGYFFPLNDGFSHKSYHTAELVMAADIAYGQYKNENLLPIVREHGHVMLSGAGLLAAEAAVKNDSKFEHKSVMIRDGADGNGGGVAILRTPFKESSLTGMMKYSTQGMGHGHFDRLSILMYDGSDDILSDYGAARFLNIPAKHGGRYLPENKTWANQTIAHNTVTVNQKSQFNAKWKESEKVPPVHDFYLKDKDVQIVSAYDTAAYSGMTMRRTLVMVEQNEVPFMIDLFYLNSKKSVSTYDYAFHYQGHLMETSFKLQTNTTALKPLGEKHGYQHLWLEATGTTEDKQATFTWWRERQFFSITTAASSQTQFMLTRAGANDPEFNLRHQPSYIIREEGKKEHLFASVIEPHGSFDPTLESVQSPSSKVKTITVLHSDNQKAAVEVIFNDGKKYRLFVAYNSKKDAEYSIELDGVKVTWKGHYLLESK